MNPTAKSDELYFVTLTVIDWIDVFNRREYKDFLVEQLNFCQQEKGLQIYAYVIMPNHIHLIASSKEGGYLSDILRDFKTYTAKKLVQLIRENPSESRKNWMLDLFAKAGQINPFNKNIQFWQNGNMPILLYSPEVIDQKINYIHENPVRAGIVEEESSYSYSSANSTSRLKVLDV